MVASLFLFALSSLPLAAQECPGASPSHARWAGLEGAAGNWGEEGLSSRFLGPAVTLHRSSGTTVDARGHLGTVETAEGKAAMWHMALGSSPRVLQRQIPWGRLCGVIGISGAYSDAAELQWRTGAGQLAAVAEMGVHSNIRARIGVMAQGAHEASRLPVLVRIEGPDGEHWGYEPAWEERREILVRPGAYGSVSYHVSGFRATLRLRAPEAATRSGKYALEVQRRF
jgi:hypothetical protein